jgi:hypothetical protein
VKSKSIEPGVCSKISGPVTSVPSMNLEERRCCDLSVVMGTGIGRVTEADCEDIVMEVLQIVATGLVVPLDAICFV